MTDTGAVLADLRPGFRDPVHGAQQAFRTLLSAMSRPGRVFRVPPAAAAGPAFGPAAGSILLALLDAETIVLLVGPCATPSCSAWLRFHTGVRMCATAAAADYVLVRGGDLDGDLWMKLALGTDEVPQAGATLIIEVDRLDGDPPPDAAHLALRGPGIDGAGRLAVTGPPQDFWAWRADLQAELPRGIDIVLVCGDRLAALPRSTRIAIEGKPACT